MTEPFVFTHFGFDEGSVPLKVFMCFRPEPFEGAKNALGVTWLSPSLYEVATCDM